MPWPWPTPNRRDAIAVVVLIAIVAAFAFAAVRQSGWGRPADLGPDWDCVNVGKGDPVCVKKPAANAGNPAPAAK